MSDFEDDNIDTKRYPIDSLNEELVKKWSNEQQELRKKLSYKDTEPWQINRSIHNPNDDKPYLNNNELLRYVGGMDISFVKDDKLACSGLFVFDITKNMELVYQDIDTELITLDLPYVPGFLAYREAPFLLKKLEKLKVEKPDLYPQCLFMDGCGCLHPFKFGAACHIGYFSDTPCIGVSKKLFQVFGLENNLEHKNMIKSLKKGGDYFELKTNEPTPELIGLCYRSTDNAPNPVYVSIGNKISWSTCLWLLRLVITKYRIPEPIRQADIITRQYIRDSL